MNEIEYLKSELKRCVNKGNFMVEKYKNEIQELKNTISFLEKKILELKDENKI